MRKYLMLIMTVCFVQFIFAQANLTVTPLTSVHVDTILKYHLAGDGVELSNGKFNNQTGIVNSAQIGTFNRNGYTAFPFETGLVMTTGNVTVAQGPNSSNGASSSTGVQTYKDMQIQNAGLATSTMNNCASLDFDFLAYADTFAFGYVFGSEEYPTYVCATYNDVFAFFLTGPDPVTGVSSTKNIAVIPGSVTAANPSGLPVSISTVNGGASSGYASQPGCYSGTYSAYYVSNQTGAGVQYDGMTTALTAEGKILACETYHMHLGICNIGDNSYDSGVFLEEKSFVSTLETKLMIRDVYCLGEDIEFKFAAGDIDTFFVVKPNGDTLTGTPMVLHDVSTADNGLYYLYVHSSIPCIDLWTYDSINISVVNTYKPNLGPDQWLCTGDVAVVGAGYDDEGVNYFWSTGDNTDSIEVITSGVYVLNITMLNPATNSTCKSSDTVEIHFYELPKPDFEGDVLSGCTPVTVHFTNKTQSMSGNYSSEWTFFGEDFNVIDFSTENDPVIVFNESGNISVKLVVTTPEGCKDSITMWNYISASAQPKVEFVSNPDVAMFQDYAGHVDFNAYLSDNLANESYSLVWDFGDGSQKSDENPTYNDYLSWGDYIVTLTLTTESGCSDSVQHIVVIEDDLIFPNVITPNGDGINDVWAIGNLNTNINPEDPDKYRNNELRISDRNGKVVFHAKNYDTYSKDGQIFVGTEPFTGDNLLDGVYYFSFSYKGKAKTTQYNGTITIVR